MQQVSAVIPRRQHARSRVGAWFAAIAIALAVGAANMGVWQYLNPPIEAPVATGPIHGLAYNAYGRWDSPIAHALRDCAGAISKRLGHGMTAAAE